MRFKCNVDDGVIEPSCTRSSKLRPGEWDSDCGSICTGEDSSLGSFRQARTSSA